MIQFFQDVIQFKFLQYALIASALASVACGIVGGFIVVRRSTYIAGAISHSLLAGMGLAFYLARTHNVEWLTPVQGAVVAAILVAVIIAVVQAMGSERMDTLLSSVWSIGMAVGITFISLTPGYNQELMSYLFGNILMVSGNDLILMVFLNTIIVLMTWLFYHKLLTISFHRELAELRGLRVNLYELVFLIMTALTIVLLVNVVGIVLVIALLTLPAATAAHFSRRLSTIIITGAGLTFTYAILGLLISYQLDWPAGPTIIELAGVAYLLTISVKWLRKSS